MYLSKDDLSKGFSNLTPRFVNEFPIFSQYFLPLLSWLPLTKDYFVPSLFQIGHMILKKAVGYVFSFCSLLPFWKRLTLWNKILPFIGINLNPIYQRTHDKKNTYFIAAWCFVGNVNGNRYNNEYDIWIRLCVWSRILYEEN